MLTVGIVLLSVLFFAFIPVRIKVEVFFDILDNGKFILYVTLPFKNKKIILKGGLKEGEFVVFLFGRNPLKGDKKTRKARRTDRNIGKRINKNKKNQKKIDIIRLIRSLDLKDFRFDVLLGDADFTALYFANMLIMNIISGYKRALCARFNISDLFFNIVTADGACGKARINTYFDMFIFKLMRLYFRLYKRSE
ncbi:MAG: hypothetical protein LBQ27_04360 [Clostridiales bacterium]|jgi:hypothetical protein|nr:hypothetical protein [Clostridiales bacterium]